MRRQILAVLAASVLLHSQPLAIAPIRPNRNIILRPYLPASIPEVRLSNSARIKSLVRAGALYLTAQDAVALALENNIDIEVARYNPLISDWRLERSQAGGALPGVPSGASQAGSVASGQGVQGSQTAAGVGGGGGAGGGGGTSNASIAQIGPVTQTLDPIIQQTSAFSHTSSPQSNSTQSSISNLLDNTRSYSTSLQQGFLTGGQVTLKFTENYLNENSPTDILNPTYAPNLSISFQHALLQGFGIAVNARNIEVARINRSTADLNFQSTVISVVSQVLDNYYNLAASIEDLNAKQAAVDAAGKLLSDVQKQVDLGSVAPPELVTSENQLVTSRLDLVNSQTSVDQLQVTLKNLLSRNGSADPVLGPVRIVPTDKLTMPAADGFGSLSELVKEARAKRIDLQIDQANLRGSRVSLLGTRNGVLPNVQVFGGESQAGLAGPAQVLGRNGANAYFVGGFGTATAQVFRRNFPTERIGVFASAPIGNNQASADQAIDELTLRQSELAAAKRQNQIEVDVQNGLIALRQSRVAYDAAMHNKSLQQALLSAEQKKYELGASVPTNVVQVERDLATAQATELSSLATYVRARIALDRTLGRVLEVNHITLADAMTGSLPGK